MLVSNHIFWKNEREILRQAAPENDEFEGAEEIVFARRSWLQSVTGRPTNLHADALASLGRQQSGALVRFVIDNCGADHSQLFLVIASGVFCRAFDLSMRDGAMTEDRASEALASIGTSIDAREAPRGQGAAENETILGL